MKRPRPSRREFLRAAAGAGVAAAAVAASASAVAAPHVAGAIGANERLRFAVVGVGGNACGRGTDHLVHLGELAKDSRWNLRVEVVCDIYDRHLERALKLGNRDRTEGKCEGVKEWERVADRKDIDCVVIATPDHWHAPMAIACMKAGKDVYLEKPMTHGIAEARDVYRTTLAEKRILQVGVQCTANGNIWGARDLVEKGALGKVVWSQTGYPRNGREGEWNYPIHPDASPKTILWDRFLGSAPKREFSGERFFRWRKYWDYSGGIATDLYYHRLAPLHILFGPEFPKRAVAAGGIYVQDDGREVPDTLMITLEYPSGHFVVLSSSMASDVGLPCTIRGHEATLSFGEGSDIEFDEAARIRVQGIFRDEFVKAHGKDVIDVEPKPRSEHLENFIECVRSRKGEDLNCGPLLGYQTMVGIQMGVDAYLRRMTIEWDATREEATG